MTGKEIKIKNHAIIKFMGFELNMNDGENTYSEETIMINGVQFGTIWRHLDFHLSFDKLIPVFNKCIILCKDLDEEFKTSKESFLLAKYSLVNAFSISQINHQLNIESCFLKITDFIIWYQKIQLS